MLKTLTHMNDILGVFCHYKCMLVKHESFVEMFSGSDNTFQLKDGTDRASNNDSFKTQDCFI